MYDANGIPVFLLISLFAHFRFYKQKKKAPKGVLSKLGISLFHGVYPWIHMPNLIQKIYYVSHTLFHSWPRAPRLRGKDTHEAFQFGSDKIYRQHNQVLHALQLKRIVFNHCSVTECSPTIYKDTALIPASNNIDYMHSTRMRLSDACRIFAQLFLVFFSDFFSASNWIFA